MIAVPRADGGVTITGSMQCPYYVHTALKRALALSDEQAVVVQAETGGGFGGKEEYPSMIAVHAALLAQRVGKPVRMIYDRHEDLAATTKRHPAIVRYRTGVASDGTLLAQDVEVVMDGGAYATLSPVVLSRGTLHAGGPYHCENVRIRSRAMATNTPPNGAFRGFGAPQTEFAAEMQVNRAAERLGSLAGGAATPLGVPRRATARRPARCSGRAWPRTRCWSAPRRRPSSNASARTTQAARERRATERSGTQPHRLRHRAWHSPGTAPASPGSGEVHLASVVGVELGADGIVRVLIALNRDRPGHQHDLPAARGRGTRDSHRARGDGAGRHLGGAQQRADRRLAHGHGGRRTGDRRVPGAQAQRGGAHRHARSRTRTRTLPGRTESSASTSASSRSRA